MEPVGLLLSLQAHTNCPDTELHQSSLYLPSCHLCLGLPSWRFGGGGDGGGGGGGGGGVGVGVPEIIRIVIMFFVALSFYGRCFFCFARKQKSREKFPVVSSVL
jgi:hypothetical protein